MKSIVVASDLSDRSRQALSRAVNLAADTKAELTVLHVVDDAIPANLSNQVQVGARTLLAEQVAADAKDRDITVTVTVDVGDTIEIIGAVTESTKADLLVVGLHRRRKFLDQIRETTMEHLIRSSDIPVLLVAGPADHDYSHVLSGVALSKVCATALRKIPMLAPQADLTIFNAHEVSFRKETEQEYETWKAMNPLPEGLPDPVFVEASAADALETIMKDGGYDLLAIGGHTRSSAGRYILGGFTAGLIRNPPCDLLIAK
ncbi:universal stress protein [uncultured Roseobacter sp.]|uniref:universal stress protein n=1 Tax=uncultured Roseobacter sp. TaxID=114847 RepID=UPI00262F0E47|nr:universal stress protein [uncultured Roseobacter sp.]